MDKTIKIIVQAVTQQAESAIKSFSATLKSLIDDAKYASTAFAIAFQKIARDAFDTASKFELFRKSSEYILGSKEAADKFAKAINDLAVESFFAIDQMQNVGRQIVGITKDVPLTVDVLRTLSDTVAATGGEYMDLQRASKAWLQTFMKTTPSLEELNRQFTNANIPVLRILAEELHKGTVELKGYAVTATSTGGVTKKQASAFAKASENIDIYRKKVEGANQRLQELRDSGKEGTSTFIKAEAALMNQEKALYKAEGAINAYNSAQANTGKVYGTTKKSVEDIMADLQNISQLGVTGHDTAMAVNEALKLAYGGANQAMMQTFAGQTQKLGEQFKILTGRIMGMEDTGAFREGSILDLATKLLTKLNDQLPAVADQIVAFTDKILASKDALILIGAILLASVVPAIVGLVTFFLPLVKVGLILVPIFFALGEAAYYLATNWDQVTTAFQGFITGVATGFQNFISWLQTVPTIIEEWVNSVVEWFLALPARIEEAYTTFFTETVPYLFGALSGIVTGLIAQMIVGWWTLFFQLPGKISEAIILTGQRAMAIWIQNGVDFVNELRTWPGRAKEAIKDLPKNMEDVFMENYRKVTAAIELLKNNIEKQINAIIGFFQNLINKVHEAMNAMIEGAKAGLGVAGIHFQHGGIVPGPVGQAVPIIAHGGERVVPRGSNTNAPWGESGGGGVTINISGGIVLDNEERVNQLADRIAQIIGRNNELARWGVGY